MNRLSATMTMLALVLAPSGLAQTARPSAPCEADPVAALTTEFGALRNQLSETTRSGLRLQLAIVRMQVQEERVLYLDSQRRGIATRRAQMEEERENLAGQLAQFSAMLKVAGADVAPEERRQIETIFKEQKSRLSQLDGSIQQLRLDENDAEAALVEGQGRLNEINAGLAALEQSLAK